MTVLTADNLAKRGITTVSDAVNLLSRKRRGHAAERVLRRWWRVCQRRCGGVAPRPHHRFHARAVQRPSRRLLPAVRRGTRNFVDLNTIPDSIVDHIDVLKDGASSTYGADAVAGVVNIIVKRQIVGLEGTAEGGISKRGDGGSQRLTLTAGHGDIGTDGYNVYLNAEYQREDPIFLRDRAAPFNSRNFSGVSTTVNGTTIYGVNQNPNGLKGNGTFGGTVGSTIVPIVRPANAAGTFVPGSSFQLLNPAAGCGRLTPHNVGGIYGTVCEQDLIKDYVQAQGTTTRFGSTAHLTVQLTDEIQGYAMFTYYQDKVSHGYRPGSVRNSSNTGDYSTTMLVLPPVLTAGPNAGKLNPNNPFAAAGQYARLYYIPGDLPNEVSSLSRSYRGETGVNGSFGNGFDFKVNFAGMRTTLNTTQKGYIYIQGLLDVIADGSYNFLDPSQNSQATRDRLSPTNRSRATSQLYQGEATITKDFFDLPGGALQAAIGGSIRYESLNDPSANVDDPANPTQQYYNINGFGAIGHRYVESGFFEINAPVLKSLEINGSGRYDHYSSGFSHFSPKIGATFTPVEVVKFRGTFSKGFRVPSFAESNALPTIGFSNPPPFPASFINQHLDADGKADAYTQYQIGLNTTGTPGLKPERSTSFTGGVVVQPVRWLSLTADYYHIKKTDVIVGADPTAAIAAYYAGQPIPAGFSVLQDPLADDLHVDAQRRLYSVSYGFVNAASEVTSGIDLEATAQIPISDAFKFTTTFSGTYVINNNLTTADGATQRYAGTLGPCNITSCSGTPRYRATWQNTLDAGVFSLTGTAYYTSGYKTTAEDVGGAGTRDDCTTIQGAHALYDDGATPVQCHVRRFINVDMTAAVKVNDQFTLFANVFNIFDAKPPVDYVTYGQNGYNPAWSQSGIVGRFYKMGANFKF